MSRIVINASIDDALHFTDQERKDITSSYLPHEREARVRGVPQLGSGRIFPVPEEQITRERFKIPGHYALIGGFDPGWDHPFAAVKLAWDRDHDTIYVTHCYRIREATPTVHAAALRPWGGALPWAWPRDASRSKLEGSG